MIPKSELGVSELELVEAVFRDEALYEAAALISRPDPRLGGRPRRYPEYFRLVYGCLAVIFDSARHAATTLAGPLVYDAIRSVAAEMVDDPSRLLPPDPPHRTWFIKVRAAITWDDLDRLSNALTSSGLAVRGRSDCSTRAGLVRRRTPTRAVSSIQTAK